MTHQRKKGKAFKSPSTGQPCDAAQYIAETMLHKKAERFNSGALGYKFWNKSQKQAYQGQVVAARRLIKEFGEKAVLEYINSPQAKKVFSLGFFTPLKFVKEGVAQFKKIIDNREAKQKKSEQSSPPAADSKQPPRKPFGKKTLFSKLKSTEKKDDGSQKK